MPPRYSYWTIIAGGLPTAFRAAEREDLLPTFHRIRGKHPDAEMKYFARGKLWASQEAAQAKPRRDRRGEDWRPGGEHRDPRQTFKDAKKARNLDRRKERFERKHVTGPREKPHGHPLRSKATPPRRRDQRANRDSHVGRAFTARPANPKGSPHASRDRRGGPFQRDGGSRRPFERKRFERNQATEEPREPPRPRDPDREPRPDEVPRPAPPPRPSEPVISPPAPPERGRPVKDRRRR